VKEIWEEARGQKSKRAGVGILESGEGGRAGMLGDGCQVLRRVEANQGSIPSRVKVVSHIHGAHAVVLYTYISRASAHVAHVYSADVHAFKLILRMVLAVAAEDSYSALFYLVAVMITFRGTNLLFRRDWTAPSSAGMMRSYNPARSASIPINMPLSLREGKKMHRILSAVCFRGLKVGEKDSRIG
jgi:hypothetical protein